MRAVVVDRVVGARFGGSSSFGGRRGSEWHARRHLRRAALAALALAGAAGCSRHHDDVSEAQSALTVPVPPVSSFAILASRNASVDDRTRVNGGSVGLTSTASNTFTAGFDTHVAEGALLLAPRVVFKDRVSTGEIGTNSYNPGTDDVTGPISAYVAPPAQPTPGTISPGTTPVTVTATTTLGAGAYGVVTVSGTLNLSGGLYQFQSLTINNNGRVVALASATVRVATTVTGLDRVSITPAGSLTAAALRLIVGGATNAVTLGNDPHVTALVVARGDVRAGDRFIFSGAIAGRDVIIGHDGVINFTPGGGFQCANNANCNDNNTCTNDVCGDAICTHTGLANGTACNDSNACTQTDKCNNAVCVGSNPITCVALDQCHDVGVCAPATGVCSNPAKANGTACSDNDACTSPDVCTAGVCAGKAIINCGGCALGDSDGDGVNDCTDGCKNDPLKTSPGICDCGTPDTDSDGDGLPDCIDPRPTDPHPQTGGTCAGVDGVPAPAGTPCDDGFCRGAFTCDGQGQCGSASQCPQPAPNCVPKMFANKTYWFCPGPMSWTAAFTACQTLQGALVQIDSTSENAFVALNLNAANAWTGGNDRTTVGSWHWATAASPDGDLFWTGGQAGSRYFARYANWASGSPDPNSAMCASISSAKTWVAGSCDATAGFVCETNNDRPPGNFGDSDDACQVLGIPCKKTQTFDNCTTTEDALFGSISYDQLQANMAACEAACKSPNEGSDACKAACQSPIDAPPPGTTCPPPQFEDDSLVACELASVRQPPHACHDSSDCAANEICGVFPNCPAGQTENCPPLTAPDDPNPSDGSKVCGTPAPNCATNDASQFTDLCGQVDFCNIDYPQTVAGFDDSSMLPSETFDPKTQFPMPDAPSTTDPYPTLGDPCPGTTCSFPADSPAHPWCALGVSDGLSDRPPQAPPRSGRAGGSVVSFNFDPKVSMERNMQLGALGIPKDTMGVKAEAGLFAQVLINGITGAPPSIPILDADAQINGGRCGIQADTTLTVLGIDFMPLVEKATGVTFPFSEPSAADHDLCEKAFDGLSQAADRAKKAQRDALELLRQYYAVVDNANVADNFSKDICNQIAAHPPRGFPAGNCGTENPEDTINRFIDYYKSSVVGFDPSTGAKGLAEAISDLTAHAYKPLTSDISIYDFHKDEEITVFQAQFFVGPIPVSLELLATLDYDATITGHLGFDPASAIGNIIQSNAEDTPKPLAYVKVDGQPSAGAGMALFAGVGFSVPGFTAKIGIEGTIHLGDVIIDGFAGSGVSVGSEPDGRGLPVEFTDPTTGTSLTTGLSLIPPKRLVAALNYDAGLTAGVRDVLSGDIALKLKIKIAFFSKTWRKRLFSFKGFCARPTDDPTRLLGAPCDITLLKAAGTIDAAGGTFPWGAVREEMPFPELKKLTVVAPAGTGTVSTQRVQEFFYDSLCTCINNDDPKETRTCLRNDDCCANKPICFPDPSTGAVSCSACRNHAQSCRDVNDCCPGQNCLPLVVGDPTTNVCTGPHLCGESCNTTNDCAIGLTCNPATMKCVDNRNCNPA